MCLILKTTPSDVLSSVEVADIYRRNGDGYGAMWRNGDGQIRTYAKLPHNMAHAASLHTNAAKRASDDGATTIWHHWRMATHGAVTMDNVHPFTVGDHAYLMHNGIIPKYGSKEESDTLAFCAALALPLTGMSPDAVDAYLRRDDVQAWIHRTIGSSRVVVLGPTVEVTIDADQSGVEHNGRWYSNTYAWAAPLALTASRWTGWGGAWDDDSGAFVRTGRRNLRRGMADQPEVWTCDDVAAYDDGDVLAVSSTYAASILADLCHEIGADESAEYMTELANGSETWGDAATDWLLGSTADEVSDYLDAGVTLQWTDDGLTVSVDLDAVAVSYTKAVTDDRKGGV